MKKIYILLGLLLAFLERVEAQNCTASPPVATATAKTITVGQSTTLSAMGCVGGDKTWTKPDNTPLSNLTVSPTVTSIYTVKCEYSPTNFCTSPVTITVNPVCTVTATASLTTITEGQSTTLSHTGCVGGPVFWLDNVSQPFSNLTVSPTVTTTYKAICDYGGTNVCDNTVTITVNPVCSITASASPTTISAGGSSTLSHTGCASGNVIWLDATNVLLSNLTVSPTVTSTYTVRCEYSLTNFCTSPVTITVNPVCTVTATASLTTITAGQSTTLSHTGCVGGSVSWLDNVSQPFSNLTVSPTITTTYRAICAYGGTNTCTSPVTITVNPVCSITASASPTTISAGGSSTLSHTGCVGGAVTWRNSANNVLSNLTVSPSSTSTYTATCVYSVSNTCTSPVTITVNPLCTITASASSSTITAGGSSTLSHTGCAGGAVTWRNSANTLLSNLTVSPSSTSTYTATCTYSVSNTCNSSVTITFNAPVCNISASASVTNVTIRQSSTLSSSGCSGSVSWKDDNGNSLSSLVVSPLRTTTYTATCDLGYGYSCSNSTTVTFSTPVCNIGSSVSSNVIKIGETTTLISTGCTGGEVTWRNSNGAIVPSIVSPSQNTNYVATCDLGFGYSCLSPGVSVIVNFPINIIDIGSNRPICAGGSNGIMFISLDRGYAGTENSIRLKLFKDNTEIGTYYTNKASFQPVTNLKSGDYFILVETFAGSTLISQTSTWHRIQDGDLIDFTSTSTSVKCFGGSDGSISLSATGGKASYSYQINASGDFKTFENPNQTLHSGVSKGLYSIQVKDSQGCLSSVKNQTVEQPNNKVTAEAISQTNPLGFETKDGRASIKAKGGTPNYTFEWFDSKNSSYGKGITKTDTNTNETLRGGDYKVKIFDANYALAIQKEGCYTDKIFTLVEPPRLEINFIVNKSATCSDWADGKFSIEPSGGVPFDNAQKYNLSIKAKGGDYESKDKLVHENLFGGVYMITISDKNKISRTLEYTLPAPTALKPSIVSVTNLTCFGDKTGAFDVTATGGTAPYTAFWNNNIKTLNQTKLPAGKYAGVVYDANKCDAVIVVTIQEPPKLEAIFEMQNPTCPDSCNGSLEAKLKGGVLPYTYAWKNLTTQELKFDKQCAGNYLEINVTDKNKCVAKNSYTMPAPNKLLLVLPKEKTLCANGSILLDATTDQAKTYQWTLPNAQKTIEPTLVGSVVGVYKLLVKDANNCEYRAEVNLKQNIDAKTSIVFSTPSSVGDKEPFVIVNLINPLPKSVEWIIPSLATNVKKTDTNIELKIATLGEYTVGLRAVFDQCESYNTTKIKVIEQENVLKLNSILPINEVLIGANPSDGIFDVFLNFVEKTDFNAYVIDPMFPDKIIYCFSDTGLSDYQFPVRISEVREGNYLLRIETKKETYTKRILITR